MEIWRPEICKPFYFLAFKTAKWSVAELNVTWYTGFLNVLACYLLQHKVGQLKLVAHKCYSCYAHSLIVVYKLLFEIHFSQFMF